MTHPSGHNGNPFTDSLRDARNIYADQVALPPRETGPVVSVVDMMNPKAPKVGNYYVTARGDYLHQTAQFVYAEQYHDNSFADNEGMVGRIMEELHDNANEVIDGEPDDDRKLEHGRYSELYDERKWSRRAKKLGTKAATAAGGMATGAGLYAIHSGFMLGGLAAVGTAAAAYGTKVYEPSPEQHKVVIEESLGPDKIPAIESSVVRELERLNFGDELDDDKIRRAAQRRADGIKIRTKDRLSSTNRTYKQGKRQILQDLASAIADPAFSGDLNWLRVDTAAKLTWLELQRTTNEAMKKNRVKRGLGRGAAWLVGVGAGAAIFSTIHGAAVQHQQQIDQQDPIHHGDTSNEVNGDHVDDFLPGTTSGTVQITAPTTTTTTTH